MKEPQITELCHGDFMRECAEAFYPETIITDYHLKRAEKSNWLTGTLELRRQTKRGRSIRPAVRKKAERRDLFRFASADGEWWQP